MARQSSKLCPARMRDFIIHWLATVAVLPRDDKKHHTQFPSMEGCRAAAGWSENAFPQVRSTTPLSLRVKRSNPVNNARTRMRATLL